MQQDARARFPADVPSSSFAPVMATGILAIAARQHGHAGAATVLLALAAVGLLACWTLLLWRAAGRPHAVAQDLRSHARAPGFFTVVAGTAVVGSACVELGVGATVAWASFVVAAASWLVIVYAVFAVLAVSAEKPPLDRGIDGSWLLAVVATESLAVLAARLPASGTLGVHVALLGVCAWLLGGVLYAWLITLIVYRTLFFPLAPAELTPPWWINMGAVAISTLAGAQLLLAAPSPPLAELRPFVHGVTLVDWVVATWWLPLLIVLATWRHLVRKDGWRYAFADWSAVFPVAMYAAALDQLADAMQLAFLRPASRAFFWAAAAMWLLTAAGFLRSRWRAARAWSPGPT